MSGGTGFEKFQRAFPKRFFDVAIAEQHGTTFAAGLAKGGITPVFAVYSSFLQRAYDQIVHDVCMQKLHVVFAIDRARRNPSGRFRYLLSQPHPQYDGAFAKKRMGIGRNA